MSWFGLLGFGLQKPKSHLSSPGQSQGQPGTRDPGAVSLNRSTGRTAKSHITWKKVLESCQEPSVFSLSPLPAPSPWLVLPSLSLTYKAGGGPCMATSPIAPYHQQSRLLFAQPFSACQLLGKKPPGFSIILQRPWRKALLSSFRLPEKETKPQRGPSCLKSHC